MPNIRSENISELINSKPPWLVRKGISLFFIIVIGLLATTWFIPYPNVVNVNATILSTNPPKEIMPKQGGRLIKLFKKDGDTINQNDVIAIIENNANYNEVIQLSYILNQLNILVENNRLEDLPSYWNNNKTTFSNLGDLQTTHQSFIQAFITFKNYLSTGYYVSKKQMLQKDLATTKKLYNNLLQQKTLQQSDLAITEQNYTVNEKMHKEELINDFEMRNQKSALINKKMSVPQMASSLIGNESQQNGILKEMMDLDNQIMQQKNLFVEALHTYFNTVEDWKNKYFITAPVNGILSFNNFIAENQMVDQNKPFCFITNASNLFTAEITISPFDIAKVKTGMEVILKFPSYPYQEFGTVKGNIIEIKKIPLDSGFIAKINLTKRLQTNRNKTIAFQYNLKAQGEIFTENKRLLQKILNGLLKK